MMSYDFYPCNNIGKSWTMLHKLQSYSKLGITCHSIIMISRKLPVLIKYIGLIVLVFCYSLLEEIC